jgi:hypothetical protein
MPSHKAPSFMPSFMEIICFIYYVIIRELYFLVIVQHLKHLKLITGARMQLQY